MKLIVVFFFFIVLQTLNAQKLINYYEDFIPQKLMQSVEFRNTIESNLSYNANIHPNLIYYYIENLKSFYIDGITNPDSNYLNQLRYYRIQYLNERSSWAKKQIQNIAEITDLKLKRNAMSEYYDDIIEKPKENTKEIIHLEKDDNLQEFFNYLFFSKQKSSYDDTKDYFQINKNLIDNTVSILNNEYKNFNNFDFDQKIEKIEKDIKFWFLTSNYESNKYGFHTNYAASELSIQTFDKSFFTRNTFLVGLAINGFPTSFPQIKKTYLFRDKPIPTFNNPISFDFPVTLSYNPIFSAYLGYQFAIKPELELFSYIKVKIGYTLILAKYDDDNKDKTFYSFTYNYVSSNIKQVYVYKDAGAVQNSNHQAFIKVVTPVLYLNKNIYFELGVDLAARFLKYDYQIQKQSVREENDQQTVESIEYLNFAFNDSKMNISPNLSMIFEASKNINISLNNSIQWASYLIAISVDYKF